MEAIIYIPGMGTNFSDQSLGTFAHRYAKALDINDPDEKKKFNIKIREESFGIDESLKTNVAAIHENSSEGTKHIIDIYEFQYVDELTESFRKKNVFNKTLILSSVIFPNIPKIIGYSFRAIFKKTRGGISEGNPGQFIYAFGILTLLASFGLLLILSFPAAFDKMVEVNKLPADVQLFFTDYWVGRKLYILYQGLKGISEYVIGFFALFYLFAPNFKTFIAEMATEFISLIRYLSVGKNRLNLTGKFEELLEKVSEADEEYDDVTVISYSFGSVIAIDTIFPMKGSTSYRVSDKLSTLVTIGCPYDFINMYWRHYYSDREFESNTLKRWYNIYSQTDILSSNFRKDNKEGSSQYSITEKGIVPINIPYHVLGYQKHGFQSTVKLTGLRAHGMYWEDQRNSASCFTSLIALRQKEA